MSASVHTTALSKKAMLEALSVSLGIVSTACQVSGVGRRTHYDWLKNDPEYKEQVESISEQAIDFAESKLFELINGVHEIMNTPDGNVIAYKTPPHAAATIFYLKTKAKKRGYIERTEVEEVKPNLPDWMSEAK